MAKVTIFSFTTNDNTVRSVNKFPGKYVPGYLQRSFVPTGDHTLQQEGEL